MKGGGKRRGADLGLGYRKKDILGENSVCLQSGEKGGRGRKQPVAKKTFGYYDKKRKSSKKWKKKGPRPGPYFLLEGRKKEKKRSQPVVKRKEGRHYPTLFC